MSCKEGKVQLHRVVKRGGNALKGARQPRTEAGTGPDQKDLDPEQTPMRGGQPARPIQRAGCGHDLHRRPMRQSTTAVQHPFYRCRADARPGRDALERRFCQKKIASGAARLMVAARKGHHVAADQGRNLPWAWQNAGLPAK